MSFPQFCVQNQKAQKTLLGGIEILIAKEHPDVLMSKTMHILKSLYDLDIVEEAVMLDWGSKVNPNFIRACILLFMLIKSRIFFKIVIHKKKVYTQTMIHKS